MRDASRRRASSVEPHSLNPKQVNNNPTQKRTMWHCMCLCLIIVVTVLLISCGVFNNDESIPQTSIELNIIRDGMFNNVTNEKKFARAKVKQHVPKFMLDLYEQLKRVPRTNWNNTAPDIVRSVVPTHAETIYPYLLAENFSNDNQMLVFQVPKTNQDEVFIRAELRVLTLIELKSAEALGIERQIQISLYNKTTKQLQVLEQKHIYHTDNTWMIFNVTTAIRRAHQKGNVLKLLITIKSYLPYLDEKDVFKLSLMPPSSNLHHDYPILLLYYKSARLDAAQIKSLHRRRRFVDDDYEEETNRVWDDDSYQGINKAQARRVKRVRNTCKRKALYVDFAEIEFDTWIVQPTGYEAYQCAGKCFYPVAEHLSPTKHAIVQALLHSVAPQKAPRSCCVPSKLDSISVLYVDAQGVLTYRYGYKDMVVVECGCR